MNDDRCIEPNDSARVCELRSHVQKFRHRRSRSVLISVRATGRRGVSSGDVRRLPALRKLFAHACSVEAHAQQWIDHAVKIRHCMITSLTSNAQKVDRHFDWIDRDNFRGCSQYGIDHRASTAARCSTIGSSWTAGESRAASERSGARSPSPVCLTARHSAFVLQQWAHARIQSPHLLPVSVFAATDRECQGAIVQFQMFVRDLSTGARH